MQSLIVKSIYFENVHKEIIDTVLLGRYFKIGIGSRILAQLPSTTYNLITFLCSNFGAWVFDILGTIPNSSEKYSTLSHKLNSIVTVIWTKWEAECENYWRKQLSESSYCAEPFWTKDENLLNFRATQQRFQMFVMCVQ